MCHPSTTSWFLVVLLTLTQTTQTHEEPIENCQEYCLNCRGKNSYRITNVSLEGGLDVSLQVSANGTLPLAHIVLPDSHPETDISINQENVTLRYGEERTRLTLAKDKPALSWVTLSLVVDQTTHPDTLLLHTPHDRIHVLKARTQHTSHVTISSSTETHIVFNCLSGCFIHTNTSAMVGKQTSDLKIPFTMYIKTTTTTTTKTTPANNPRQNEQNDPKAHLTLRSAEGGIEKTLDASNWAQEMWYRVKFLEKNGKEDEGETPKDGKDGVKEVDVMIPKGSYSINGLKGLIWTLHCAPNGLTHTQSAKTESGNTTVQRETPVDASDNGRETGGEADSAPAEETKNEGGEGKSGRAGAGVVTAWVMAGLALFLVMILAVALCSKTAARNTHPHLVHDSQPSVGIIYCKNAKREPEEDSEPESPNELKLPNYTNSGNYQMKECKVID